MAVTSDLIRLRYPATCSVCGNALARGTHALWEKATRTATCEACLTPTEEVPPEIDRGTPGASAAREWTRRHQRRETAVGNQHKHLGGLILALSDDPQSTASWGTGARGEQTMGASLDKLREGGMAVLHDRRIPGSRANIDHVAISQAGVFVIDTKLYKGRVEQRDVGGWFKTDIRLYVGGRDRSKLVTGMKPQVDAVRAALEPHDQWRDVPITAALLFMSDDNWSIFASRPLRFGDVYALWGKKLGELLRAQGAGPALDVAELERTLAAALPVA
jgi:Nuclease-related domain